MAGKYFDEWQIGDRIEHEIRRTVTETDNLLFTTMTHNPQPLHLDAEAAKASEFGQILVNGKPRWGNQTDSGQNKLGPSDDRWKERSKTYTGIAAAMAEQWGDKIPA